MTTNYVSRKYNNPSLGPIALPNSFSIGGVHYRNTQQQAAERLGFTGVTIVDPKGRGKGEKITLFGLKGLEVGKECEVNLPESCKEGDEIAASAFIGFVIILGSSRARRYRRPS